MDDATVLAFVLAKLEIELDRFSWEKDAGDRRGQPRLTASTGAIDRPRYWCPRQTYDERDAHHVGVRLGIVVARP